MAKKKKQKKQKHPFRNAAPRIPRAPRATSGEETPLQRLGYTAAGAAATSVLGAFLATKGLAPKTVASALSAVGAGLAWRGDAPKIRSIGAGTMAAGGGQLAYLLIDDKAAKDTKNTNDTKKDDKKSEPKKPANVGELPPGALESALERARTRMALASSDMPDGGDFG